VQSVVSRICSYGGTYEKINYCSFSDHSVYFRCRWRRRHRGSTIWHEHDRIDGLEKKEVRSNAKLEKNFSKAAPGGRMTEAEFAAWETQHQSK
jgi:hypothetical protein